MMKQPTTTTRAAAHARTAARMLGQIEAGDRPTGELYEIANRVQAIADLLPSPAYTANPKDAYGKVQP